MKYMNLWKTYEFIVNITDNYLLYFFLQSLFENKFKNKFLIVLAILLQSIILLFLNTYFGVASFLSFIIILCIINAIYFKIFSCKLGKLIFITLIFFMLLAFFDFLGISLTSIVFNISPRKLEEENIYRLISGIGTRVIFYFCLNFFIKSKISPTNIKKIHIYQMIIILISNIFFIFIIYNSYQEKIFMKSKLFLISFALGMVIYSFIVIKIIQQIVFFSKKELEWSLQEESYKKQIFYINNIQDLIYTLKAQRHDFNHHIGCIYGLLNATEFDEATKYSNKLVNQMSELNTLINIDNPIISALLNFKLSIAKKKQIEMNIDIQLPVDIKIDSIDICILLGNALDNAIEACEHTEDKFIRIEMYIEKMYFIVKIINSKNKNMINSTYKKNYLTTKLDKENHGFGLTNINCIVNKYNGLVQTESTENFFLLRVALLIE